MTAEIVNLRRARKARARAEAATQADRNRAAHGRTLSERDAARVEAARLARELEGARREE